MLDFTLSGSGSSDDRERWKFAYAVGGSVGALCLNSTASDVKVASKERNA